jgi:hypothetical protein
MKETLIRQRIRSFSRLEENWNGYGSHTITEKSMEASEKYLDSILDLANLDKVYVFPLPSGGIQFEIGDFIEVEILDDVILEFNFEHDPPLEKIIKL